MELTIRDAKPDDAAGIVAVFNPIIAAGFIYAVRCYERRERPPNKPMNRRLVSFGVGYRQPLAGLAYCTNPERE
jgi:hypothetical protein